LSLLLARLHAADQGRRWRSRMSAYERSNSLGLSVRVPVVLTHGRVEQVMPVTWPQWALKPGPAARAARLLPRSAKHYVKAEMQDSPADLSANFSVLGPFHVIIPRHGVVQEPLFDWPPVHEQRVAFGRPL
jgi:hypothetical protein